MGGQEGGQGKRRVVVAPQLADFVERRREQGADDQAILSELQTGGWDPAQVEAVMGVAPPPTAPTPQPTYAGPPSTQPARVEPRPPPFETEVTAKRVLKGLACGLAAAVLTGIIWALIWTRASLMVGIVAFGIGYACGYAVALGSGAQGRAYQVIAGACSVVAIAIGKIGVTHINHTRSGSPTDVLLYLELLPRQFYVLDILWIVLALMAAWPALSAPRRHRG
ncbi:MAG TPA: hypothetical protein QGH10_06930 [Armatimonadota bacterium]|nr:hypothetical protein [Armatimonadota bacterium]